MHTWGCTHGYREWEWERVGLGWWLGSAKGGEKVTGVTTPSRAGHHCPSSSGGRGWRVEGIKGSEFKVTMNRERLGKEVGQVKQGGGCKEGKTNLD